MRAYSGRAFHLVHEDEHLAVVDKAPQVLTVPTPRGEPNTVLQLLGRALARGGRERRVFPVHRLDRGTSGLLVFARDRETAEDLRRQFSLHRPRRVYVAVVSGYLPDDEGTFASLLATNRALTRYSTEDERGERAVTHYRVVARRDSASVVRVVLETGKRNQIRVHFAEAGHPVLGDRRYRPELAEHARWPFKRLALHASLLGFRHPATGRSSTFTSPLPREFARFLRSGGSRGDRA